MHISPAFLALASFVATAATVTNAFVVNKQFYPSIVYITKSNASMMVIYVQALILVYILFQMVRKIFFGELRASEAEHLSERAWHAVLETCLAFTVFRDDFSPLFVMQFVGLLFVKSFHWLADDRVDMMERSPVITLKFHIRMMCIVAFLGATDSYLLSHAYFTTLLKGASAQIVFGFEYAILMALVIHVTIKYILHMHDLRTAQAWENKAVYLLYAELFINLIRCVLYGLFAAVMLRVHSFPLFSVRPFYLSLRALHKAINDVILSRRAINAMNNLFPIVSAEDLATMDATCIICRDEMTPESTPKRLPCGHVFHTHCLRSWFQRQQTCPTCRTDILAAAGQRAAANGPVPPAAPNNPPVQNGAINARLPPNLFPFMAHQFAVPQPRPPTQDNTGPAAGAAAEGEGREQPAGFPPGPFPGFPPPFPQNMPQFPSFPFMAPLPPFPMEMPRPPPNLDQLTEEDLRAMEGQSRAALERRIKMLQDISTLLDAAVAQMHQYSSIFGTAPMPVPMPNPAASDSAWQTLFAQNPNQSFGGASTVDVNQGESVQDVKDTQEGSATKDTTKQENGAKTENTMTDVPSTSKSLFGTSASSSRLSKAGVATESPTPEDRESPEVPSSSKETIVRSPEDERIRQRRLRRFAEAGNSSEDR
uniref:E3 ubiquitin-protein ligase hrd-1 n=1 Tax=Haemonchus contortus TaxID=6289 RepID=A0A7I4Z0A0_HAECO